MATDVKIALDNDPTSCGDCTPNRGTYHPLQIYLFGSRRAYDAPGLNSGLLPARSFLMTCPALIRAQYPLASINYLCKPRRSGPTCLYAPNHVFPLSALSVVSVASSCHGVCARAKPALCR